MAGDPAGYVESAVMNAVADALPAMGVDYRVVVHRQYRSQHTVQLLPLTEKGRDYLPYLAKQLKKSKILGN